MTRGAYTLAQGQVLDVRVTLQENRITLAAVDVRAKGRCQLKPQGAELVAQLLAQVRTALLSSTSSVSGTRVETEIVSFVRNEDRDGRRAGPIERVTTTLRGGVASASALDLERAGYVVQDADSTTIHAPDAEVLLSESFVSRHCFFLAESDEKASSSIGIGFRPVSVERGRVDVRGTLWLNRNTTELQYVEYVYEPLHVDYRRLNVGGRVGFRKQRGVRGLSANGRSARLAQGRDVWWTQTTCEEAIRDCWACARLAARCCVFEPMKNCNIPMHWRCALANFRPMC
ncbi:MAG: hypothetical protein H7Z40_08150 [Phycisphaerae bacterium]|nr:hypothetical protein [Gemmatimonadaceae bacterium]